MTISLLDTPPFPGGQLGKVNNCKSPNTRGGCVYRNCQLASRLVDAPLGNKGMILDTKGSVPSRLHTPCRSRNACWGHQISVDSQLLICPHGRCCWGPRLIVQPVGGCLAGSSLRISTPKRELGGYHMQANGISSSINLN
jgi:hypothetical protein